MKLNDIITAESLRNVMTQREYRDYCQGLSKKDISAQIQSICVSKVDDGTYTFKLKEEDGVYMNAHTKKSLEYLFQNLLIRKLNQNIIKAYRLKTTDRRTIIKQIVQLLQSKLPIQILRKDIHHFFESVNPSMILDKLRKDGRITIQTLSLIETLLGQAKDLGAEGLPRGLSISSGLTEYLLRKFDYEFIRHEGVMLYGRFVDDMIFVCTTDVDVQEIQKKVDISLQRLQLSENLRKRQTLTTTDLNNGNTFDFLGYQFTRKGSLEVDIAEQKLKKIKTRIVIAFKQYLKDKDGNLLVERMKYLSCTSTIQSSALKNLQIGIPANYVAVMNSNKSLTELDTFYRRVLYCRKGVFGKTLHDLLATDNAAERRLRQIGFRNSFDTKRKVSFTAQEISRIKNCWHG